MSISIVGISMTVIILGRSAVKKSVQAVGKFGMAIANIAKKFGPILGALGTCRQTYYPWEPEKLCF